jgi:acyl-CoA reductase-like NAD-dependent aldehyde dehydrogenase
MAFDHSGIIEEVGASAPGRILIDGEWLEVEDRLPVVDPSTGVAFSTIAQSTEAQVDDAVAAARKAYPQWRTFSPGKRRGVLLKLVDLTEKHGPEIDKLVSLEMGAPVQMTARLGTKSLRRNLEYFVGWIDKFGGDLVPVARAFDYAIREPLGVVGLIIPWNVPLMFLGSKLGPALAMGNTVVLKPSELASKAVLRWAELLDDAGIPRGVVNVVTGDGQVGAMLASHPGLDKIAFTGSTATGRKVAQAAAANLTPVSLELGGKSPSIIFKDTNTTKAAMQTALGIFAMSGQTCAACSRVFVEEPIYEEMLDRLTSLSKVLKVGDPLRKSTVLGPLVAERQIDRVMDYIESGKQGARLVTGGDRLGGDLSDGYFLPPTIFADVDNQSRIAQEEIFGPVLATAPFSTLDEVIALANDTRYGLAAGIWTDNIHTALKTAHALDAGVIWINNYGTLPPGAPFGGYKGSGYGRDGGKDVLLEYTQAKNVYIDLR